MATKAEINAAFDVVHSRLVEYINNSVPWYLKGKATSMLQSDNAKEVLIGIVEEALQAAEKVRSSKTVKKTVRGATRTDFDGGNKKTLKKTVKKPARK